ncbi:MAG: competence/damage-inducible protein A [Candidatus Omnitrophota bacterium]
MKAEIISIGTEILLGHTIDTNSAYISKKLAQPGIDIYYQTTVGDNPSRLLSTIQQALGRSDIVFTIGGLGPTVDDITLNTLAEVSQKLLILNKPIQNNISTFFKKRHMSMPKNNIRQAYIPKGAKWFKNEFGTAPGLKIKIGKKILFALPGPPRELIPMFEKNILPTLKELSPEKFVILTRTIKTTGLAESQLHPKVKDLLQLSGNTTVGIYASPSEIKLKITSKDKTQKKAEDNINKLEKKINARLEKLIFGIDEETLEGAINKLLKNKKLAIAESCTGGLISSRLTDTSGISKNLLFSVVAYSNTAKTGLLNIPENIIKKHGAVSSIVAKEMAKNIMSLANSDIGIGITGIAGPSGGSKEKPVGLVHIALADSKKTIHKKFYFNGTRTDVKFQASQAALNMLRLYLL